MRAPALLAAAAALAAAAPVPDAGSRQTRDYVQAAGQSDAFEMLEAETALTQSTDPQVRGYAQQMLRDHQRTGQALAAATAASGLAPPPAGIGAEQAPLLAALQGVRGADFDKLYWRHQVIGHVSALTSAQGYAASGDDPNVRRAAQAALPTISAHLAAARQMAAASGGS